MTERPDHDVSSAVSEGDDPTIEDDDEDEREAEKLARSASGRRGMVVAVVVVPVLGFALLLATGLARDPRELPSELVGKRAPEFSLPRLGERGRVELARSAARSWC